jgi:hypothetical protein
LSFVGTFGAIPTYHPVTTSEGGSASEEATDR